MAGRTHLSLLMALSSLNNRPNMTCPFHNVSTTCYFNVLIIAEICQENIIILLHTVNVLIFVTTCKQSLSTHPWSSYSAYTYSFVV